MLILNKQNGINQYKEHLINYERLFFNIKEIKKPDSVFNSSIQPLNPHTSKEVNSGKK